MRSKRGFRRARAGVVLVIAVLAQFTPSIQGAQAAGSFGLSFNGAGQYVTFGRAPGLGAGTFTVETWFRRTGPGRTTTTSGLTGGGLTAVVPLVTKGRAEADGTAVDLNYFLGIQGGVLAGDYEEGAAGIKPGLNHAVLGTTPIVDGLWYHAALTFDGSVLRLYLNGVQDAEVIVGAGRMPRSDSLQHAALATAMNSTGVTGGGFDGQLDEARIWNIARDAAQVHDAMGTEIVGPQAGLLARWGMNEGTGTVVGDSAGSGINGTAVGAPPWGGGFQSVEPPIVTSNAPADGLTGVGGSTTLQVTATDPQGLPVTVQFFGRPFASGTFARIATNTGVASGTRTSTSWTGLVPGQTYEWYATADDGSTLGPGPTRTFSTTPGPDPVLIGAGDIAQCGASLAGAQATAQILRGVAGTVYTAGDDAYPDGAPADFTNCYDPTWGAAKSRTRPAPGNHEWRQPGLSGYFGYFGAGVAANASGASYYSYDLGSSWHAVVLDSECAKVGGCGVGSPQLTWLRADLQANQGKNVVAIWHKPRFGSGRTNLVDVQPFWDTLYEFGADLVVVGHDHIYERLAPIDATGAADPVRGIRQFTVGTGGSEHHTIAAVIPTSEARDVTTFGVLKLTLHPTSYDWTYMPVAGGTYTDRGSSPVNGLTNSPPSVSSVTLAPGAPLKGDVLTATAVASDPDGTPVTLRYTWQRNGVTIPGESGATLDLGMAGNGDRGDAITATAIASDGSAQSAPLISAAVTIVNSAPTASGAIDDPTPATDEVLTAAVDGADPDGDPVSLTYRWRVNSVLVAGETGRTFDLAKPGNGNRGDKIAVNVTPSDGVLKGTMVTYRATIVNALPAVGPVTINPTSPGTNDVLTATASATDADGDPATLRYQWRRNGTDIAGATARTLDLGGAGNGDPGDVIAVAVSANDGIGTSPARTSDPVTVAGSSVPTVQPVTATTGHRSTGVNIPLLGSDPSGRTLTYTIVNAPQRGSITITGSTARYVPTGDTPGTDTFTYRASNGVATSLPATGTITLTNTAPTVTVALDDPTPGTNAVLAASASGTDADGDLIAFTFEWRVNGVLVAEETGSTLDLSKAGNGNKGDLVAVAVTPSDGHVNGAIAGAQATVRNGAPTVGSVSVTPSSPNTNDVVSANVSASDPDGDALTYGYQWRLNGVNIPGQTGPSLDLGLGGNGDRGDQITVVVSASDGTATSTPATSGPVSVGNRAPAAAPVTASVPHRAGSGVDIPLLGTDPDGDPLTFTVVDAPVNGTVTITGSTAHYTPTGDILGTDTFTYRANDGALTSAPALGTVTRTNTAPTVTVALDDPTPGTNAVLAASAAGTDADGDLIAFTFEWRVNGVLIAGETGSALDLSKAGNGNKGDLVAVAVTPSDGHVNGAIAGAQATVRNGAPTVNSAMTSPGSPGTNGTLSASATASDPDADPLSINYQWRRNGVDIPGQTGATLDLGAPGAGDHGDVITLAVTASDGFMTSATVVADPVIVANTAPSAVPVTASVGHRSVAGVDIPLVGSDLDGDALTFTIVSPPANGGVTINGSTAHYTPSSDTPGTDTFTYRASDGILTSAPATGTITLTNATPGATVTLDDPTPGTNALLHASAAGTDADGDPVTFTYQWRVNGTVVAGENGATLDLSKPGNGNKGDAVAVAVTPSDGHVNGAVAGAQATVRNGPPVMNAVTLSSSAPRTNDVLSASVSATDPDGDAITYAYRWQRNGVDIAGQTGATLNLSLTGNGNRGDQIAAIVTASDSVGTSGPLTSAAATVVNTAPTATATFDLAAPPGNLVATGRAVGSDLDGDAVWFVYVWKVNGVVRRTSARTTSTTDTFDLATAGNGNPGDTLSLEITPNDGTVDGAFARVQATVGPDDQAPTAQDRSVIVAPGTARTIGLQASDPEGDALTYEIVTGPSHGTLTGSGASRTYTPSAGYSGADAFTFRVRDAYQASTTATVTIRVSQTFNVTVNSSSFSPSSLTVGQGDAVLWSFTGPQSQSVTDQNALGLLNSGSISRPGTYQATFIGAGTYPYRTTGHGSFTGTVSVPLVISPAGGPRTAAFKVTWAAEDAPTAFLFDVEYLRPGSSSWLSWRTGVRTVSASFTPDAGAGTYSFRARLRNASNGAFSGWSNVSTLSAT